MFKLLFIDETMNIIYYKPSNLSNPPNMDDSSTTTVTCIY